MKSLKENCILILDRVSVVIQAEYLACLQIRPADDKLAGGHAGRNSHWCRSGWSPRSAPVAIRRLFQGCRTGEQNGKQRPGRVRIYMLNELINYSPQSLSLLCT